MYPFSVMFNGLCLRGLKSAVHTVCPVLGKEASSCKHQFNTLKSCTLNTSVLSTRQYGFNLKVHFDSMQDEIYGTAFVAAYYLRNILKFPVNKKVYVLGMQSMADELDQMGIVNFGVGVSGTYSSLINYYK